MVQRSNDAVAMDVQIMPLKEECALCIRHGAKVESKRGMSEGCTRQVECALGRGKGQAMQQRWMHEPNDQRRSVH